MRLCVANRGEIAIRIARAAAALGVASVALYAVDDADSLHVRRADEARPLPAAGAAAYLDAAAIVAAARAARCDAVHPGYGFLSEDAAFARLVTAAGMVFVGPSAGVLETFGDKVRARALARECGVPVPAGSDGPVSLAEAHAFYAALPADAAMAIKAVTGGGGRGIRIVRSAHAIDGAYARARSEAAAAGSDALYVETVIDRARHIEVQVVGDGTGAVQHLFERDCSLQRRNQKLIEIAPAPHLPAAVRDGVIAAALRLARAVTLQNVTTFEFLTGGTRADEIAFIEANPRLQVEHTVTEEVLGIDIVALQLQLAAGATLAELGLERPPAQPRGFAVQLRLNAERTNADGTVRPAGGTIAAFEAPSGPGVRVDTYACAGYTLNPSFDSLLAKIVVRSQPDDLAAALGKARRTLAELRLTGVATNAAFLAAVLALPEVGHGGWTTRTIDEHLAALTAAEPVGDASASAGAGSHVTAPLTGRVVAIEVAAGAVVRGGATLVILESMKMEHVVAAPFAGSVIRLLVQAGDVVREGVPLLEFAAGAELDEATATVTETEAVRPDLAESLARHAATLDAARPEAIARRHAAAGRTARENIADLCDAETFVEYGALALPAQRRRRPLEELIARYPADGLVAGFGDVNGALFEPARTRCLAMSYDYTVFAGTQGAINHRKTDRMLGLAREARTPIVFFLEGGGGRPGDTDALGVAGLDVPTFASYAALSGFVPRVGIVAGRCFAGNAALLGCSDVIIATQNATIGMGGPAMIEGGGLGVFAPEAVGPLAVQVPNGVVDVAVADEAEAVRIARQYLSYFQGTLEHWTCAPQERLRSVIPQNRLRVYDVRSALTTLADTGSVLELRPGFAPGMVTALARVQGRPLGVIANDPRHLAGAVDSNGADKAARFMQLCDAFGLPLLYLCDCPGFMVGPAAEATGLVRHAARMFLNAASVSVPFFTIVLRKGYGLGAMATAGGGFHSGAFTVAWPTGEFGAMGLEGAVRLGFRDELAAIADPLARERLRRDGAGGVRCRHRDQHGLVSRDRRRDRSGGFAALDRARPAVTTPRARARPAPQSHRCLVEPRTSIWP